MKAALAKIFASNTIAAVVVVVLVEVEVVEELLEDELLDVDEELEDDELLDDELLDVDDELLEELKLLLLGLELEGLLLLALGAYADWDESRSGRLGAPGLSVRASYWVALGCFLLALLAKSSVVMFPALLLLYVWWKRGRIMRLN